jgi:LuxR family quorum-sensing transcriptional regulator LasR
MKYLEHSSGIATGTPLPDLYNDFVNLAASVNLEDWTSRLQALLRRIGFKWYLLSLGSDAVCNDPFERIITTFPEAWLQRYQEVDYLKVDPIVKHCKQHMLPLFWARERQFSKSYTRNFWVERETFGLGCGISIPLRYSDNVGSLNVAHSSKLSDEINADCKKAVSNLFFLIPFALEGLVNIHRSVNTLKESLTLREQECLKWAASGKTSWEIGKIIGCSERTVNFHFASIVRKLDVCNRRQAVAIAVSKNLISIH